ncbi:MAG: VCBS repeat-containing protein [Lacibacter sp.]|nr:VCBS repeat-containing protein [Lacibacter sp.]
MKHFSWVLSFLFISTSLNAQTPTISSIAPQTGAIGTVVTITGTNFSTTEANNAVFFGSVKATVTAATATSITVVVPFGAGYEPLSVAVNNLIAYSSKPFTVTYPGGGMDFISTSFAAKVDYSGGGTIIDADWDTDGKIDIAYNIFAENRVFFYRNTSTGSNLSFTNFPDFFGGLVNVIGLAKGDFNGDGKLDLVAATPFSNAVYVFRNGSSAVGSIFFFGPTAFTTGSEPRKVTVADIDADGKLDIISSNKGANTVSVLRNTSTATTISFETKIDFAVATAPEDITAGDLDGDGKPEIAIACSGSNVVSLLRNTSTTGAISFASKTDLSAGSSTWGVAIGDIDSDGKAEVLASNLGPNTISVFKNNSTTGSLSFDAAANFTVASSPRGLKLGDLNADGKPDVAVACYFSNSLVSVLKNTSSVGTISFNATVNYTTAGGPSTVALADMNNDGLMDMMAGTSTTNLTGNTSFFKNELNINTTSAVRNITDITLSLEVYPNPSTNWAFIKHPMANKKGIYLVVTDISGKQVLKTEVKTQTVQSTFNISQLQPGVYFVTWNNGNETGTVRLHKK